MNVLTAFFTPSVPYTADGVVHSVFDRTANLMLCSPSGERMITLADPYLPPVPDSILMPRDRISAAEPGMPVILSGSDLVIGKEAFVLDRQSADAFHIDAKAHQPCTDAFLSLTEGLPTGFEHIPVSRRKQACEALCTENGGAFIGLGPGLTPSYDDACVGMMAVFCANGRKIPFVLPDLSVTTDVSARYLRLAREGYFGMALKQVIDALYSDGDLKDCIRTLLHVGATSGSDMLYGMRRALQITD